MKAVASKFVLTLCVLSPAAWAEEPPCRVNYKQEGNLLSGRRFSTWDVVPNVSVETAFKRIYVEGTQSGLTVASSDKEMGVISFEQANAGSILGKGTVSVPWNVSIDAEGTGVKIRVTKLTPPNYNTGKEFQMKSMCGVIDAARG